MNRSGFAALLVVSLLGMGMMYGIPSDRIILTSWRVQSSVVDHAPAATETVQPRIPPRRAPDGTHSVLGPPSLSAEQIDRILALRQSPAAGTGAIWIELGSVYGIDPAYALAFFFHESGAGTNPRWAGRKPDGSTTHNVGNIICSGYPTCYGRFRDYASWREGIEDWYRLIAVEYVEQRGVYTVETIVPIYAPSIENNVGAYINAVNFFVAEWRAGRYP